MIIYTPEARRLHEPFRGSARTAHLPPAGCWATALLPRKLSGMLRSGPPFARLVRPEDSVHRYLVLSIYRRNELTRVYHELCSPDLLVSGCLLAASLSKTFASASKSDASLCTDSFRSLSCDSRYEVSTRLASLWLPQRCHMTQRTSNAETAADRHNGKRLADPKYSMMGLCEDPRQFVRPQ